MKADYTERSGVVFDEASDIAIKLRVLAGEIFNAYSQTEWLKRQMFASTATGEFLDHIAEQRGLTRRAATKAQGTLTFSVNETKSYPVTIPSGTVVATTGAQPVRVYTTEDAVLPLGTLSVDVRAEAELPGFGGNILIGTATVPVSMPAELDSVRNRSVFEGGADTEADNSLRKRIKDTYYCVPNGMNKAYYIQLAQSVDGVDRAGVVTYARGAGTINVYVNSYDGTIGQAVIDEARALILRNREINVDVEVLPAVGTSYDMAVTVEAKAGYTAQEVRELCTNAFEEYLSTIPLGGTLYLSALGKYLLDTDCIENYVFDMSMSNMTAAGSQFFISGDVDIEVT
ncbi:MAG: baseplate J/gp47 family protein [Ruminococcus sp.]|nr:baseplate J/gp47 family protein [Ruminococcus sp.]